MLASSDANKTPLKLVRNAHWSFRTTTQKRWKNDPQTHATALGAPHALRQLSGSLLERLWDGPGALFDGSWALLARPGRPQIGLGASFGCPKTVSSASGRVPETTLGAQTGPRLIFLRFWVDLGWIFVDFRNTLRRFSLEPRATKARKRNLKKESCDPHRASWPLRYAVTSYCPYVFRNGLRMLRVQSFFVAYPQAHLVSE